MARTDQRISLASTLNRTLFALHNALLNAGLGDDASPPGGPNSDEIRPPKAITVPIGECYQLARLKDDEIQSCESDEVVLRWTYSEKGIQRSEVFNVSNDDGFHNWDYLFFPQRFSEYIQIHRIPHEHSNYLNSVDIRRNCEDYDALSLVLNVQDHVVERDGYNSLVPREYVIEFQKVKDPQVE